CRACGIGKGEAPRALFLDQFARRLDQRFAQIAVMVGPLARATFPAHVKTVYIDAIEMETPLDDRLLQCLRERLGNAVAYAEPPMPLSGGFDTSIYALRLTSATG